MVDADVRRLIANEPGDHPVDVAITCVLTRFRLRSVLHLLPTYLGYRRVRKAAAATPGLLHTAFLVSDSRTCYSFSIWASPDAIPRFGTNVPQHVEEARRAFGRLAMSGPGGPELWSTKWQLRSVSNNLRWGDFDLRAQVLRAVASSTGPGAVS